MSEDLAKLWAHAKPLAPAKDEAEDLASLWEKSAPVPKGPGAGEAVARGAAQGLTLGFADELTGGLEALKDVALTDKTMDDLGDAYRQRRDESRANYDAAEKAHKGAFIAGNIGGGLATVLVPGLGKITLAKAAALGGLSGIGSAGGDLTDGEFAPVVAGGLVGGALGAGSAKLGSFIGQKLAAKFAPKATEDVAQAPGLKERAVGWLDDQAERSQVKALGAMLGDQRSLAQRGRLNEVGRDVLDLKPGPLATVEDLEQLIAGKADDAGEKIGNFTSRIDAAASRGERFNPARAAQRVESEIIAPLRDKPAFSGVVEALEKERDKLGALAGPEGNKQLSFIKANELKRSYDDFLNFDREQTPLKEMMKRLRGVVNSEIEDSAEAVAPRLGPDEFANYKEAKRLYGNLSDAKAIAGDRVLRNDANRSISLTDTIAGVGGLTSGGLPTAVLAGGLNRAARERGSSAVAWGLNKAARTLESVTFPSIAKLAATNPVALKELSPTLARAALNGEASLATAHALLLKNDPAYRARVEAMAQ